MSLREDTRHNAMKGGHQDDNCGNCPFDEMGKGRRL